MSFSRQKLLKPQNKKQDVLEYKVLPSYMYKVWAQMNKKCKSSSWVAAFLVLWAHHATQCACLELRFCFASMWFLYRLFIAVSSIPLKGPFSYLIMQQWQYKNRRLFTRYKFKLLASCAVNGEVLIKHNQIGKFRPANP